MSKPRIVVEFKDYAGALQWFRDMRADGCLPANVVLFTATDDECVTMATEAPMIVRMNGFRPDGMVPGSSL